MPPPHNVIIMVAGAVAVAKLIGTAFDMQWNSDECSFDLRDVRLKG
jgi:hypothetical protein